jgi:tRNA C32,U32 (ribose-2'-O)-methylase TrmJ
VFLAIALAGLVMVVCYVVWLAHKAADVLGEAGVLADQAGQLAELLSGIGTTEDQRSDGAGRRLEDGFGRR